MPGDANMFKIAYEGGGETPNVLKGDYTSHAYAQKALKNYLVNK